MLQNFGAGEFEMLDQLRIRRVTVVRIFLQHAIDDIGRLGRDIGRESLEAGRLAFHLLERDKARAFRLEGRTSRDGMEKCSAQAVDIAAKIFRFVIEPLRRDVIRGAPNLTARAGFFRQHASQTEVDNLGGVRVGEENVARFDITVNQPLFRRRFESLRDLRPDLEHLRLGNAILHRHQVVEGTFFDQLHSEVKLAVRLAEGIDADHVRMIDRGGDARLLFELGPLVFTCAHFTTQDFQGDHASEIVVVGLEDGSHAALADQLDQFEIVEDTACTHPLAAMRTVNLRKRQFIGHVDRPAASGTRVDDPGGRLLVHAANLARDRGNVQRFRGPL